MNAQSGVCTPAGGLVTGERPHALCSPFAQAEGWEERRAGNRGAAAVPRVQGRPLPPGSSLAEWRSRGRAVSSPTPPQESWCCCRWTT